MALRMDAPATQCSPLMVSEGGCEGWGRERFEWLVRLYDRDAFFLRCE